MSDPESAALITVMGMLGTSVAAAWIQFKVTKLVITSEREKESERIAVETRERRSEARVEKILNQVSHLVGSIDPATGPTCLEAVAPLVVKTQLLLNGDVGSEGELNQALNRLGHVVQACEQSGQSDNLPLLQASDDIIKATQGIVKRHHFLAVTGLGVEV